MLIARYQGTKAERVKTIHEATFKGNTVKPTNNGQDGKFECVGRGQKYYETRKWLREMEITRHLMVWHDLSTVAIIPTWYLW